MQKVPISRSSCEFYFGIILAVIAAVFQMTWWLKLLLIAIVILAVIDLTARSPRTINWTRFSKTIFSYLITFGFLVWYSLDTPDVKETIMMLHIKFSARSWWAVYGVLALGGIFPIWGYWWLTGKMFSEAMSKTQKFSWSWNALTMDESNALFEKFKAIGHNAVHVYSVSPASRALAASIDEVFGKANWNHYLRIGPPISGMVVGVYVGPDGEIAKNVKKAIEEVTPYKVSIKNLKGMNPGSVTEVIIGAKPIPSLIPIELQNETKTFGQKLKDLSADIMAFAADRKREEGLLPVRETYSPDQNGARQWWQRGVDFARETETLYNARFSSRTTPYMTELCNMGIGLPFVLQHSESKPEKLSKWYSAIGDCLIRLKIDEARAVGNDEHLWFG